MHVCVVRECVYVCVHGCYLCAFVFCVSVFVHEVLCVCACIACVGVYIRGYVILLPCVVCIVHVCLCVLL